MKRIRVYRHRGCRACARKARLLKALDWLGRTESSTNEPASGPLRMGQVIVEDIQTGQLAFGAEAFDLLCQHIPLYMPLRLLLVFPPFYRAMETEMNGTQDAQPTPDQP